MNLLVIDYFERYQGFVLRKCVICENDQLFLPVGKIQHVVRNISTWGKHKYARHGT